MDNDRTQNLIPYLQKGHNLSFSLHEATARTWRSERNWVWVFLKFVCSHNNMKILEMKILVFLLPKWHCQFFAKGLCQKEDPLWLCSFLVISITYSDWQRKLHAHVLKSLVEILGIFVSSYNCSVWEAGPFSLSLSFLSSHCLHCYSSQTFSGHSQASCASPVTHISVTCPEMKLSQGLWKGQTALGG